jgi:hypothetical protein
MRHWCNIGFSTQLQKELLFLSPENLFADKMSARETNEALEKALALSLLPNPWYQ